MTDTFSPKAIKDGTTLLDALHNEGIQRANLERIKTIWEAHVAPLRGHRFSHAMAALLAYGHVRITSTGRIEVL